MSSADRRACAGASLLLGALVAIGVQAGCGSDGSSPVAATTPTPCPPAGYTWVPRPPTTHHYALLSARGWPAAEDEAVRLGGHLASIADDAENAWLVSTFGGSPAFFIGFTDRDREGSWVWTSGEPVTYTNWFHGSHSEPNDSGTGEDVATINYEYASQGESGRGKWNDVPISVSQPAIVEVACPAR